MTEDLLQFIWKHQLFDAKNMRTEENEPVNILKAGYHNQHAGPDFFESHIKIGNTVWAGNIEIHIKASDWYKHGHDTDQAYDNVILHVVQHYDKDVYRKDGSKIPVFTLAVGENYHLKYNQLRESRKWVACEDSITFIDEIHIKTWLQKLTVERLENKVDRVNQLLMATQNDWEHVLWVFMARALGTNVNAEPFQRLMVQIPMQVLFKHVNNPIQIEALLFGCSGLLDDPDNNEYALHLRKEFKFLKNKYQLMTIEPHNWKMLRLRPANFPHVRIAQLAALIRKCAPVFEKMKNMRNTAQLFELFDTHISDYWVKHSNFGQAHKKRNAKISRRTLELLAINAICPVLFSYGQYVNEQEIKDRAIDLLYVLSPEKNSILEKWKALEITGSSAADTQALIHLKKAYCDQKKCLSCAIGGKIVMEA
ncbi:MAG: DUF2851 family protein [Bacteroidetes bacterium]|jgi:hypothetical protein|nr:DUF2851 family protein [Bacteroidota bacterium]